MIDVISATTAAVALVAGAGSLLVAWRKSSSEVQAETVNLLHERLNGLAADLEKKGRELTDHAERLSRCEQAREALQAENLRLMRQLMRERKD